MLPVGPLSLSHALVGASIATALWEPTRHLLVWYFATLSQVGTLYGSLATAIVVLLSLEIGAAVAWSASDRRIRARGECADQASTGTCPVRSPAIEAQFQPQTLTADAPVARSDPNGWDRKTPLRDIVAETSSASCSAMLPPLSVFVRVYESANRS